METFIILLLEVVLASLSALAFLVKILFAFATIAVLLIIIMQKRDLASRCSLIERLL